MDPGSIITGAKTAITGAEVAHKGWGWLKRFWSGTIAITNPQNRAVVHPEWVAVDGTHGKPKGIYWLVTHDKDRYWPQCRINLHPDGRWAEKVNVSVEKGPRPSFVILAWTSEFMDSIFQDYKDRGNKTKHWGPLKIKPPKREFQIVQEIVLTVVDKPSP